MKLKIEVNYVENSVIIEDFRECRCFIRGEDDGLYTCWKHHNCALQECTHAEEDLDD